MSILVIAEHDNKSLRSSTHHTVSAAGQLGADVHILVAGFNAAEVASAAAALEGVSKVLHADSAAFEHGLAENLTEQVLAVASAYQHLLFPATAFGKNLAPRVAARLDVAQVSDVTAIQGPDTFQHPIYAGNAIETVQALDAIKVLTIRTTAFDAVGSGAAGTVESIGATDANSKVAFVERNSPTSTRPELAGARVVVSGGRAVGSAENFALLEALADKLGGALGASRAAVDAGFAPNDWQVGQTGKIVAPELYIAVGISGAIQHLAGMKDAKVIVAINKDPEAPIFSVADYGLVGDLFTVVPALTEAL